MSDFLGIAQARGLKTCLYSGKDKSSISPVILERLDYLKYGPYMESKGGLGSPETNQVMEDLATGENITYKFSNVLPKNNIIRKEENA
jgi:anaerobic ribonucleoside-triphosphate reductase activating protein